jgi:hypothetical protein
MCTKVDIPRRTNHALKSTAATRLYQAGLDDQLVRERTRHKTMKAVQVYKKTSEEQKQRTSELLNVSPPPSTSSSITAKSGWTYEDLERALMDVDEPVQQQPRFFMPPQQHPANGQFLLQNCNVNINYHF